jgi:hypothetical protein
MEIEIWSTLLNKWIRVDKKWAVAMVWNFSHWKRRRDPGSVAETVIDLMLAGF